MGEECLFWPAAAVAREMRRQNERTGALRPSSVEGTGGPPVLAPDADWRFSEVRNDETTKTSGRTPRVQSTLPGLKRGILNKTARLPQSQAIVMCDCESQLACGLRRGSFTRRTVRGSKGRARRAGTNMK